MNAQLPDFSQAKVLVVGDVMLDQYWHGQSSRLSPEAPVPVVKVEDTNDAAGGAGNCAVNLAALGARATLSSVTGSDGPHDRLRRLLSDRHIHCRLVQSESAPTIYKLRVFGRNQQLSRVDFEKAFAEQDYQRLKHDILTMMPSYDVVVFSDYGKGISTLASDVISKANELSVPVLVDPKSANFHYYRNATLITPNRQEFEAVVGECPDQNKLEDKAHELINGHGLSALLITQGSEGMTLVMRGQKPVHMPTQAREVYDVTGAGDTVIALMAAVLGAGGSWHNAMRLANAGAGRVVAKLGTSYVTPAELRQEIVSYYDSTLAVVDHETLLPLVHYAKAQGETIVMTNGCFDLLHEGHIHCLEKAKQLGSRLIVAVNSDDSVKNLKGDDRPIKPLSERMSILSALKAVDWVVSFDDETPERLIQSVMPDVLVKGGDWHQGYTAIAGAQHVKAQGGEVRLIDYRDGHSTTEIIHSIRGETV